MNLYCLLPVFICFPLLAEDLQATENKKANVFYKTLIKQDLEQNDINLIVKDTSIELVNIIANDAGEVGYVLYLFSADIIWSFPAQFPASIKYTMSYEGSLLPQLSSTAYYVGMENQSEPIWNIDDTAIKLPLANTNILEYAKGKIIHKTTK
ncbi:hypothetical protein MNBD_GAMMA03-896 [hydrothermal vent metagenome]|uniref:Uncharacterized protein n=1 Tax=hydrothermal vent metagenome TaxID=652676 RepID=A0A3B0WLJ2_9ZZZZ